MQVGDGRRFYPFDPRPEEIHIEDIAGALSRICRFGGHTRDFYSVAQHSVMVSQVCAPEDALWGLLHDAAEAYIGDLPRPIKRHSSMMNYRLSEGYVMLAVTERFGLEPPDRWVHGMPESVHRADEILLATEARDLMGNGNLPRWDSLTGIEPLPARIQAWGPDYTRLAFMYRFRELTGGTGK
jgi:hypothetical protein